MTVGRQLTRRFKRLGIKPCQRCRELARQMDENGPAWCEDHIDQLSRQIESRIRGHRQARVRLALFVPAALRRKWIKRQIRLAIKQARKQHCQVGQNTTQ